jgi:hypothetical protein
MLGIRVECFNIEFSQHTWAYFNKILMERINKFRLILGNDIKKLVVSTMEKFAFDNFSHFSSIDRGEVPRNPKNSLMSCCAKKKSKMNINLDGNSKSAAIDLKKSFSSLRSRYADIITEENRLDSFLNVNRIKLVSNFLADDKLKILNKKFKIEEKLKNEVDKFSEIFNLKKIISKQTQKIKAQRSKLSILEDAKTINDCIICCENVRNILFYPCLHYICCETCTSSKNLVECPHCKKNIENKQIIN